MNPARAILARVILDEMGSGGTPTMEEAERAADRVLAVLADRGALRAALDVHREARNDTALTPPCEHCHGEPGVHPCGCWADEKWQTVCAALHMDYPCHTVRAIEAAMQEVAP